MKKKISISSLSTIKEADNSLSLDVFFDYNLPASNCPLTDLEDEPDTLRCELPEEVKIHDGTRGLEGELLISKKGDSDVDFEIDVNGDLLVRDLEENYDRYYINQNGELIYEFI